MLKKNFKKAVAAGMISLIGMSVFAAGCSATNGINVLQGYQETNTSEGSLSKVDDDNNASVSNSDSVSTDTAVVAGSDSTDNNGSGNSLDSSGSSDGSEEGQIMQDGKYIHKIGDGSVTLALETNIYDYLETVPDYRNGEYKRFALEKLAPDLGWTSETGGVSDVKYYAYLDDRDITLNVAGDTMGKKGANGKYYWDTLYFEVGRGDGSTLGGQHFYENAPEKAIYMSSSGSGKGTGHAITLDNIVITTFIMEHKDDLYSGDSLDDIFGAWKERKQRGAYIIPK